MCSTSTMRFLLQCSLYSFHFDPILDRLLRNAEKNPTSDGHFAPPLLTLQAAFNLKPMPACNRGHRALAAAGLAKDLALLKTQELVQTGIGQRFIDRRRGRETEKERGRCLSSSPEGVAQTSRCELLRGGPSGQWTLVPIPQASKQDRGVG